MNSKTKKGKKKPSKISKKTKSIPKTSQIEKIKLSLLPEPLKDSDFGIIKACSKN